MTASIRKNEVICQLGFKEVVGNQVCKSSKAGKPPPPPSCLGKAQGALGWLGHGVSDKGERK